MIEGSACVCDAENGWSEVDGVCACAAEGFTLVGTDCVANNACLDDTSLNCAPNTAVTPAQDCSATDPRKCAACAAGFEFDAVTETVSAAPPLKRPPCDSAACAGLCWLRIPACPPAP